MASQAGLVLEEGFEQSTEHNASKANFFCTMYWECPQIKGLLGGPMGLITLKGSYCMASSCAGRWQDPYSSARDSKTQTMEAGFPQSNECQTGSAPILRTPTEAA
jgi:hypothetical protein